MFGYRLDRFLVAVGDSSAPCTRFYLILVFPRMSMTMAKTIQHWKESRRGYKRRRKDRKHKKRQWRSIRDDVSSLGPRSNSGETVDTLSRLVASEWGRVRKIGTTNRKDERVRQVKSINFFWI